MSWRLLGQYNRREHWTVYFLGTTSNLLLSVPLYTAARAGILALVPPRGSTSQFIASYGTSWGVALDFLWTLLVFQGIFAVLVLTVASTTLIEESWRWLYVFSAILTTSFVGYWLGARFIQALAWVSILHNSGIETFAVYSDLFWFGLGATIFYVAMILFLRKSYDKLTQLKSSQGIIGYSQPVQ